MKIRFAFLLLLPYLATAQVTQYVSTDPAYIRNITTADEFFEAEMHREAIPFYLNAMQITEAAFRSKYRLAYCYLMLREFASANYWLQKVALQNPEEFCVHNIFEEKSTVYHFRPFLDWRPLQVACLDGMPQYNYWYVQELTEIRHFDQFIRSENRKPNEADCKGKKYYWPGMSFMQVDSVNQVRVEGLIKAMGGYPGLDRVGESLKNTVWLVIQHAPIEFQEKYYPLVEKAAQEGQITMGDWAYLVDRMNMNRGVKQIYGSQMRQKADGSGYEIYQLEDPFNVNKRRAEVGLVPIEQYIEHWGLKFEPEKMQ